MFEIIVRDRFSAAHRLPDYDGDCANVHGHNWTVELCLQAEELDGQGMVADFRVVRRELTEVLKPLDHKTINVVPPFDKLPPTSEVIARFLFHSLKAPFKDPDRGVALKWVRVFETEDDGATYYEEHHE